MQKIDKIRGARTNELYKCKANKYTIEGLNQEFNNLLEVYKFCKKQVINGELMISSNLCQWGKVKAVVSMKLKNVKEIL